MAMLFKYPKIRNRPIYKEETKKYTRSPASIVVIHSYIILLFCIHGFIERSICKYLNSLAMGMCNEPTNSKGR